MTRRMTEGPLWNPLARTLENMLLAEPGSRVEGPTEDTLRAIFEATVQLLEDHMPHDRADAIALQHLVRVHEALTYAGYIVRDYPAT